MTGEQHVVAGGEAAEDVIGDHLVGLVLEEEIFLLLVDVQPQGADAGGLEGLDGGVGVEQAAPAGVDDHHPVLHLGEGLLVQQVVVLLEQGTVQADDVGLTQQGVDVHVFGPQIDGSLVRVGIAHQQAHAKALEDAQGGDADLAGAYDAGGAAMHVEADQPLQGEVGVAGALVGLMDAAVEGHHQAHRVLGDRLGGVGGYPHHFQTQLLGGHQIHVVVTGAAQGDDLGAVRGQLGQHLPVGVIVDEQADHGEVMGEASCLGLQPHVEELQLEAVLAVGLIEVFLVVALGTENGDSHGALSADNDVVKLQQIVTVITG